MSKHSGLENLQLGKAFYSCKPCYSGEWSRKITRSVPTYITIFYVRSIKKKKKKKKRGREKRNNTSKTRWGKEPLESLIYYNI